MDPLSNIQTTTSAPPPYSTHAPPGNFISTISVGGRSSPPPARGHPTTWPEKGSAGTDDGSWSTSQATFAGTKNDSNMAVQAPVANSLAITSPPSPNPMYPPPNKPIPTVSVGGSYSPPSARGQPLPLPVWPERPDPAADVTGWRWIGIVIPAKETNPSQITGRAGRQPQFPVPCSYYCCHAGGLLSLLASLCCCVCGFAAAIYTRTAVTAAGFYGDQDKARRNARKSMLCSCLAIFCGIIIVVSLSTIAALCPDTFRHPFKLDCPR